MSRLVVYVVVFVGMAMFCYAEEKVALDKDGVDVSTVQLSEVGNIAVCFFFFILNLKDIGKALKNKLYPYFS